MAERGPLRGQKGRRHRRRRVHRRRDLPRGSPPRARASPGSTSTRRPPRASRRPGAEFAAADVTDRAALDRALDGAELVVHAAAYVRDWGDDGGLRRASTSAARVNVLDAAEAAGAERVVHISSVVVYGYHDPGEQDEAAHRRTYGIPYIDTKSASDGSRCAAARS